MAKYTTQVRTICENYAGLDESVSYSSVDEVISSAQSRIFENYPIFNEEYRSELNKKILRHFYMREIGLETVGLWKLYLNNRMHEIMPYYNQLYESCEIEFSPLRDYDYTKSGTKNTTHSTSESGESDTTKNAEKDSEMTSDTTNSYNSNYHKTGTNTVVTSGEHGSTDVSNGGSGEVKWDLYSDTPQGGITGMVSTGEPSEGVETGTKYLTNARKIHDTQTNNNTTTNESTDDVTETSTPNETTAHGGSDSIENSGTEKTTNNETINSTNSKTSGGSVDDEYTEHVFGKSSGMTYSKMLQEYRETFMNIDMMIINELNDLFMNIW